MEANGSRQAPGVPVNGADAIECVPRRAKFVDVVRVTGGI